MKDIVQNLNAHFDNHKTEILDQFFDYLKIKSISTDPEYKSEVLKCSLWVEQRLKEIGFTVEAFNEPGGHPCIFGERIVSNNAPTVLFYGHYDVQPVDPIELWASDPFSPEIRNGEIYARGAEDNKGQSFYVLQALKTLKELNQLPKNLNIKVLIEGEEETGSKSFPKIISKHKERLAADYLYVVDTGMHSMEQPAVTLGCRGIITMTLTLTGSNSDLHSGEHGGITFNPLHALVNMLARARCPETGKILVPKFYDRVITLDLNERKELSIELPEGFYENIFASKTNGGEKEFSALESAWIRPTLEINGIAGGYAGKGFKTVIPATATAKVSCRLVPDQDPDEIADLVMAFFKSNCPEGIKLEISDISTAGKPFRNPSNTKLGIITREVIEEVTGKKCVNILAGGSIPITANLAKTLNADTLLIGFGLPEDQIHAPNEHFGVDRIKLGHATIGAIISKLDH